MNLYRRLQKEVQQLRNVQKEEEAKEELKRLIVLGALGQANTSKLPRTDKIFGTNANIDPSGYSEFYNFNEDTRQAPHKRHDFKKHARMILDTSYVEEDYLRLQNDR